MSKESDQLDPIKNEQNIKQWFHEGIKKKMLIGTEHEVFLYQTDNCQPAPLYGEKGVSQLLQQLSGKITNSELKQSNGVNTELLNSKDNYSITLEPGAQLELSGRVLGTIHQIKQEVDDYYSILQPELDKLGLDVLPMGTCPIWSSKDFQQVPKQRYYLIQNVLTPKSLHLLDIMFRTCAIQVNIDYLSIQDLLDKAVTSFLLSPFVSCLFANSPFHLGFISPYPSLRSYYWRHYDPIRSGIPDWIFNENISLDTIVDWYLDIPILFLKNNNQYQEACVDVADGDKLTKTTITFRQFLNDKQLHKIFHKPTIADFINHLACVLPDVRIKQLIEIRSADCVPKPMIPCLGALFAGIFANDSVLQKTKKLMQSIEPQSFWTSRELMLKNSLNTKVKLKNNSEVLYKDIIKEVLDIAKQGLEIRNITNSAGKNESIYLDSLFEIVKQEKTLASRQIDKIKNQQMPLQLNANIANIYAKLSNK